MKIDEDKIKSLVWEAGLDVNIKTIESGQERVRLVTGLDTEIVLVPSFITIGKLPNTANSWTFGRLKWNSGVTDDDLKNAFISRGFVEILEPLIQSVWLLFDEAAKQLPTLPWLSPELMEGGFCDEMMFLVAIRGGRGEGETRREWWEFHQIRSRRDKGVPLWFEDQNGAHWDFHWDDVSWFMHRDDLEATLPD